ncbi:hypothetical protein RSAG8_13167, partial [Rhizoctonia solani AG-8 WAC10335]
MRATDANQDARRNFIAGRLCAKLGIKEQQGQRTPKTQRYGSSRTSSACCYCTCLRRER